jgi:micrococcal nuclease
MIAVMTAARAVGEGLSPVEPFESRAAAIRAEVAAVQRDLSIAESERRDLPVARRPVSPAWVPTGALALVLVATALGSPTVVSGTVDDAATASTAEPAAVQTTSVASEPGSTTLPATTTTVSSRDLVSFTALATLAAGPSGDPAADPPAGSQPIEILSITDGDTFDARFADGSVEPIRLIGINSPEGGECMADVAGAALGVMTPVGSTVHVTSDVSDRDQFDRLLRYVWVGSLSVNEELVRRGMAIARRYPPDVSLAERLEGAQASARAEQAGLWAPNACGSISAATVRVVALNYDAAGDDNVNLNGEWIQLRNLAHVAVDLTGWTIRDESATHRYGFPTGFTLGANETVTIHSGCGTDFSTTLYWCSQVSAIWNNDGDTAFVVDPNGNIHSDYSYRPATTTTAARSTTTTPPTTSPPTTLAAPSTTTAQNCHPSYPTVCIPPPPPDLNCGDIPHRNFTVTGSDPHRFDGDNDGVGCES